ncbi:hypothetical protein CBS101457_006475 [Exobasidium rhododendri]|nr:hypothetical protein CBS101457_006475 [Exobasidium rhododendri]
MVTRQRPRKANMSSRYAPVKDGQFFSPKKSRLSWLVAILALTTALLIALQLHRRGSSAKRLFHNERRSDNRASPIESLRKGKIGTEDGAKLDEMRQTIAALSKQFQKEFGSLNEEDPEKQTEAATVREAQGKGRETSNLVAEEGVVNTIRQRDASSEMSGKAAGKGEDDKNDAQIGLEDMDQDTLKAMFDLLYARD